MKRSATHRMGFATAIAAAVFTLVGGVTNVSRGAEEVLPKHVTPEALKAVRAALPEGREFPASDYYLKLQADLAAGHKLQVVQKFGTGLRNIDTHHAADLFGQLAIRAFEFFDVLEAQIVFRLGEQRGGLVGSPQNLAAAARRE